VQSLKPSLMVLVIASSILLLLIGCTRKPSDSEIAEAVRARLQNNVPVSWVGNLMGGRNAIIHSIEIIEWGSFNIDYKYWPAKIRVIGSAKLNDPFNQGKTVQFDEAGDFLLSKDDYGKWKAELKRGMFQ